MAHAQRQPQHVSLLCCFWLLLALPLIVESGLLGMGLMRAELWPLLRVNPDL